MKYQYSKRMVEFAEILPHSVGILHQFGYNNDFFLLSHLETITGKLPLDVRFKRFKNTEKPQDRTKPLHLIDLSTWLQEQAILHERLMSSLRRTKYDHGKSQGDSKEMGSKDRSSEFETDVIARRCQSFLAK